MITEKVCPVCGKSFTKQNKKYCSIKCYLIGKKTFNKFKIYSNYAIMFVKYKNTILKTKIDKEDVEKIKKIGKWHATHSIKYKNSGFYFCNRPYNKSCIKLHRFIMNCPDNMVVDHVNHDTLDNRKQNLRIVTQFENNQNQRNNKSGVCGVYQKNNKYGYWVGKISKNGITYQKEFKHKEDAIKYRIYMYNLLYKDKQ